MNLVSLIESLIIIYRVEFQTLNTLFIHHNGKIRTTYIPFEK